MTHSDRLGEFLRVGAAHPPVEKPAPCMVCGKTTDHVVSVASWGNMHQLRWKFRVFAFCERMCRGPSAYDIAVAGPEDRQALRVRAFAYLRRLVAGWRAKKKGAAA